MPDTDPILITGGAGFIGTHLCRRLVEAGRKVVCLDLRSPPAPVAGVAYRTGDVRDRAALDPLVAKAGAVVHLAATVSVPLCQNAPLDSYSNNFDATLAVLEALRAERAKGRAVGIVFASSAAVYGNLGDDGRALREDELPPRFASFYAAQKHACEKAIELYSDHFSVPGAIFRFFNVFGPGQDPKSPYSGVITVLSSLAERGQPLPLNGGGSQTRDFVSVHDVVSGLAAMLALPFDRWTAEPINLGSGASITVREVAGTISRLRGGSSPLVDAPPRSGDVRHSKADISRARARLGFSPQVSFEDGLAKLLS
jgi:UDP-glucose 4-epimerase